jgi:hypothetical protein
MRLPLLASSLSIPLYVSRDVTKEKIDRVFAALVAITYISVLVSGNLFFSILMHNPVVAAFGNASAVVLLFVLMIKVRKYLRK